MKENSLYIQALQEVFDAEFENDMNALDSYGKHTFTQKHDKKMKKLIDRQSKPYFKLISTAGRRAACVAAAIILFSASALSVKAVREAFFDFIMRIFSDHNEITIQSETDSGYPAVIENEYYISAIPEGFEQMQYMETDRSISIYYEDDNGNYILFTQTVKSQYTDYFDNENSVSFYTEQDNDGQEYMIIESEYDVTLIWDNGEYILTLLSNSDKNEAMQLCRSIKIKN